MAALLATLGLSAPLRAQTSPAPEAIGNLVGDDVTVKGAIRFGVENGRSSALLASGSEITVRSGKARIDLESGDMIAVCGPAHFTIIEAGGTFTLALDYGEVHPQLTSAISLTVYMPLIVATPVAIGQGDRATLPSGSIRLVRCARLQRAAPCASKNSLAARACLCRRAAKSASAAANSMRFAAPQGPAVANCSSWRIR